MFRDAASLTTLSLSACASPNERRSATVIGQWVWSARDAQLYREVRRDRPALVAGVWVATIAVRADSLSVQLGNAPLADVEQQQVVIRLDDSLHRLWAASPDSAIAARLTSPLTRILAVAGGSSTTTRVVQLDYDAPVRLLPRYAHVLQLLRRGVLAGRALWITSLVAHVDSPQYGALFRPVVDGHIVQLFDTGDTFTPASTLRLRSALRRAEMPFMVGVGMFERSLAQGRVTTHRAWLAELPKLEQLSTYRGLWIFPAGTSYHVYLPK